MMGTRIGLLLASGILAVVADGVALTATVSDEELVKAATANAVRTLYASGTFDKEDWSGATLRTDAASRVASRLERDLASSMTGEALTELGTALADSIERERKGEGLITVGGGAKDFEWAKVSVGKGDADVTVTAYAYRIWIIKDPTWEGEREGRSARRNTFQAHLVRSDAVPVKRSETVHSRNY